MADDYTLEMEVETITRKRTRSIPETYNRSKRPRPSIPNILGRPMTARIPIPTLQPTNHEIKWIDRPMATFQFLNTGALSNSILLNGITQGTGTWGRIGNRVEMQSLHINGMIFQNPAAGFPQTSPDLLRWAVVYDRAPETRGATLPFWQEVFSETHFDGTFFANELTGINLDNKDRFIVLRNKFIHGPLWAGAPVGSAGQISGNVDPGKGSFTVNEHIKLNGLVAQYINPNTTIGSIGTGALYFITQGFFAAQNVAVNPAIWAINCNFRLKFKDA